MKVQIRYGITVMKQPWVYSECIMKPVRVLPGIALLGKCLWVFGTFDFHPLPLQHLDPLGPEAAGKSQSQVSLASGSSSI